MRKNKGWWIFALATLLPAVWLFATAEEPVGAGWMAAAGLGWLLIVWSTRRRHRAGTWFANRCGHCRGLMRVVPKRRLRPPPGAKTPAGDVWHCPRCGKMVR